MENHKTFIYKSYSETCPASPQFRNSPSLTIPPQTPSRAGKVFYSHKPNQPETLANSLKPLSNSKTAKDSFSIMSSISCMKNDYLIIEPLRAKPCSPPYNSGR